MSKLTNEMDKKNRLLAEATQLVTRGLKTQEDRDQHARFTKELDDVEDLIRLLRRVDGFTPAATPAPVAAPAIIQSTSKNERAKVNDAARIFFKHGEGGLNAERRALLTTSDTTGEAVVSQLFDSTFIEASKFAGNIFDLVNRKDAATGEPTKFVVTDGTNQTFSLLTEGTTSARSANQTPTLFSDITGTDTLVSSVVYSVQELEDASDVISFLNRIAGNAVLRAWEHAITLGTTNDGSSTALPNSPSGGFLGFVVEGATTSTLAAGIGYSDLIGLTGSVDHSYYVNGAYMASASTHKYLLGLKDGQGRPYFLVNEDTGLLMINGKPLYVYAAMPAYNAASSPVVRHFNVSVMDSLRVPLKTIQERIGHALTGSFTLDVYGHTLDWKANEEAATSLGVVIAKAVTENGSNQNSGPLTAHNEEGFQTRSLEALQNS
jgi:HK97 family phage major capsid protein